MIENVPKQTIYHGMVLLSRKQNRYQKIIYIDLKDIYSKYNIRKYFY